MMTMIYSGGCSGHSFICMILHSSVLILEGNQIHPRAVRRAVRSMLMPHCDFIAG